MQLNKEILIIDDNQYLLSLMKMLLEQDSFKVLICPNPASALALAGEWPFDIFIIDYRLPYMNGDALTAAIRKMHPSAIIIGCSIEPREREFLAAGADTFIFKDQLVTELPVFVRHSCAHEGR